MAEPRVYTLPPGADFPSLLVMGLCERMADEPPEAMARVRLYVNAARMRRRVEEQFIARGAMFLPQIRLVSDLASDPSLALPAPVSALRRRLELAQLVSGLLKVQPKLAPRAAVFDLADSLAKLMDEMQGEGVSPAALAALDVSGHSAHWARTQAFLGIIAGQFSAGDANDTDASQRRAMEALTALWQEQPPEHPVIVAGSTGSRGATALFMKLVARLPKGAVVLPGFDQDTPPEVWEALSDALTAEDHPQYRFRRLADLLDVSPTRFRPWCAASAPNPARNRLLSLSLRPAPVTDRWLTEGPLLPDLCEATAEMALIEAATPREEALAVALALREAAEAGVRAALVTPDRGLGRMVAAALDRWAILPDDAAGQPLGLSAPGRFLRHVADLFCTGLTSDRLLVLLKHPMTASDGEPVAGLARKASGRGQHLRFTRALELTLRRKGPVFPTPTDLINWAAARNEEGIADWAAALAGTLDLSQDRHPLPLVSHVARHRALAESLARGPAGEGSGGLWLKEAGIKALGLMDDLATEAIHGGEMTAVEYRDLLDALLSRTELRETVQSHPDILIWGTLDARVQGAELVILGGLNDGIWPKLPEPDPWLNRKMRKDAGLLLPERQIGLSAHDYQQAAGAPKVILSRALRNAEAETVPSRWLNRLVNLMRGLPGPGGPEALSQMQARGAKWVDMARALEQPTASLRADPGLAPAPRPSPQPPVRSRPNRLALTAVARLIRDPYAIYARQILRLFPLDPLRAAPDARERGTLFHDILERFVRSRPADETRAEARQRLLEIAASVLAEETPFPSARTLWLARLERAADHFLTQDSKYGGTALVLETRGELALPALPVTLYGTPDRIDRLPDGRLHLIDYKTGTPPTEKQQRQYEKQLLLAAAMAERGGFPDLGPSDVAMISYIGLGAGEKVVETLLTEALIGEQWQKLITLITRYMVREKGYTARRAVFEERFPGDYDHLSRLGEWETSDAAKAIMVGPADETEDAQ